MGREDILMLSQEELRKLHVIRRVLEKEMRQAEAAEVLGLTDRQIRRIVRRIVGEGDRGVVHRGRGKASNRRTEEGERERILGLYEEKYRGFGPTLASEKLQEIDGIGISDETLRLWLVSKGVEYPGRRRQRAHRRWRERKERFGEMVQMDGSHHDWLEGRGPKMVLMGYIDDATGEVFGRFYGYEGTIPALESFKHYIRKYGVPLSMYVDRHSTYKSTRKATVEEELAGQEPESQFERALGELGVKVIHAHSPQAKGRIERLFKTFQDRVIKEMRLAGVKTLEEANAFLETYLPKYNQRFRVRAAQEGDLHRRAPSSKALDRILCLKTPRTVRNDATISHEGKLYQIKGRIGVKKVVVEERIDGRLYITAEGMSLNYTEILNRPVREVDLHLRKLPQPPLRPTKPAVDHPWRQYKKVQALKQLRRGKGEAHPPTP